MFSRRFAVVIPTIVSLLFLVPVSASAAPTTFADTAGTPHEVAVAALVEEGIVQGCGTDRFCSRDELTRGQLSTILVGALELPEGGGARFSDTGESAHRDAIDALAGAGLASGCGDGRFCPSDPVTREQLATMIHRGFDVADASGGVRYFDDTTAVHGPAVRALAEAGITSGCGTRLTSFCPGEGVERAHAAVFLARALDLIERAQLRSFDERKEAQDRIDAEIERKRAEAQKAREQAEAEAKAALAEAAAPAQTAVDIALAQTGKPYRWAGSGPNSFDCSGLTSYAWAKAGVKLPRTSRAQYAGTTRISRSELRPGDLVFYYSPVSHVAMYIGDGRVVEAPNSGNVVRIRNDGLTRRGLVGYGRP